MRLLISSLVVIFCVAVVCAAQTSGIGTSQPGQLNTSEDKDDGPASFSELMAKRRLAQLKKEHKEMLKRGDEALRLSEELEESISENNKITPKDSRDLADLEKLLVRIRNDLGGRDVDDNKETVKKDSPPSSLPEAFGILKSSAESLVSELRKTSRFSVSAVAIETSNSLIKLTRFLRLRK